MNSIKGAITHQILKHGKDCEKVYVFVHTNKQQTLLMLASSVFLVDVS